MKTTDRYTKSHEKAPEKAGTYMYTCTYAMSMWEPPALWFVTSCYVILD